MVHQFSQVPKANIPRSSFDRSHGLKTTFDAGFLVPIFVDEAVPGDTFSLSMTAFARMATPVKPIMDNLFMETFFFAVPKRLLWSNWNRFMGERVNPDDSIDYTVPQITCDQIDGGSIHQYIFGLTTSHPVTANVLWHRAYARIFNEWFRDANLQNAQPVYVGDGPDTWTDYQLLRRGKRHDYFTSALPWPQRGDAVSVPLGQRADVKGIGFESGLIPDGTNVSVRETLQAGNTYANAMSTGANPGSFTVQFAADQAGAGAGPNIWADLSTATAVTINTLRQAFQIQRLQERDARGGTRLTEIIRSHFGVISPDARMQRPEFLGGGSSMINVNPVAQTSETATGSQTPQGNLSAYATATLRGHGFTKSFTEHCVVIGLVNVRADLTYQQGLDRMFSRRTRLDYYWPVLSQIGEQAVLNKEIYHQGTAQDDEVWAYQERYAEYRFKPSRITGKFASKASGTLDVWHLSQNFASLPALNNTFIQDTPPISRVLAVQDEPQFLFDAYFNYRCARPMPVYGVPGMIDHF